MYAALKPNGKIMISMPAGYPEALANALTSITADEKWNKHFVEFKLAQDFFKQNEYTTLLEKSGFENIDVQVVPMFDEFPSLQAFSDFVRQWLPHLQPVPTEMRDAFMMDLMKRYVRGSPANEKGEVRFSKYTLQARALKGDENKKEL
jgi:trans-aconitate methyltransferase